MRKKSLLVMTVMLAIVAGICFPIMKTVRAAAAEGTDVLIKAEFIVPKKKMRDAVNIRHETMFRLQYRVARANMPAVDVTADEEILKIKARGVVDPEDFKTFLTRPGAWQVLDENGKDVFTLGSVRKVLVGTDENSQAVLVLTQKLSGAAKEAAAGGTYPVTLVLDGEKTPMTLKIGADGTTAILTTPELTEVRAWQLRSLISLAPYPCTLTVTDFRFGDDLLRQIIGW